MRITIIGSGNVAYHLATSLHNAGHQIVEVFSRNEDTAMELANIVNARSNCSIGEMNRSSTLYLCALPDDSIEQFVHSLPGVIGESAMLVHTSGVHGLDIFPEEITHAGVFYPLQTFTRGIPVDMSEVPILIDARNKTDLGRLTTLADTIPAKRITGITKDQKAHLHLAAVFVNNFPTHLFSIAEEICVTKGLDFKLLRPLMDQTLRKLDFIPPAAAQTGPAIRRDLKTIETHETLLEGHPLWKEIYTLISRGIAEK